MHDDEPALHASHTAQPAGRVTAAVRCSAPQYVLPGDSSAWPTRAARMPPPASAPPCIVSAAREGLHAAGCMCVCGGAGFLMRAPPPAHRHPPAAHAHALRGTHRMHAHSMYGRSNNQARELDMLYLSAGWCAHRRLVWPSMQQLAAATAVPLSAACMLSDGGQLQSRQL